MSDDRRDPARELLRHTLATLAYRAEKAIRDVPDDVANVAASPTTRTPRQILAHIGDLLAWGLSVAKGQQRWRSTTVERWDAEVSRFFTEIRAFDDYLASDEPLGAPIERIFQGPIADALTHVGQIAILRRVAGAPVRAENYFRAEIVAGRVGRDQSTTRAEFD